MAYDAAVAPPIFLAHAHGLPVHVWVSETRPRLQGANLTAWELAQRGVPHTIVVDSACAALMRRRDVEHGLATLCVGGGLGGAIVFQRVAASE